MNRLKDRYLGDTLLLTGTRKIGGVPTAISTDVVVTMAAQTATGKHALEVVADPDQVANPGKFTAGALMTGWGVGLVTLDVKVTVDGVTPITDITETINHTPPLQFLLKEPIT